MGKLKNLSFAHLVGFGTKAKAVDEDEKEKENGERDHEDGNAKKAETNDEDREKREDETDDEYKARMKKMEENDDEEEAKAESDEDKKDDDKKEEDKETEMRGSSVAAAARLREQSRCAAIFSSPAAAKNPELAANLAFKTRMPRNEALAVLEGTRVAPVSRYDRSARNPNLKPDGSVGSTTRERVAKGLDAAFAKVMPRR